MTTCLLMWHLLIILLNDCFKSPVFKYYCQDVPRGLWSKANKQPCYKKCRPTQLLWKTSGGNEESAPSTEIMQHKHEEVQLEQLQ